MHFIPSEELTLEEYAMQREPSFLSWTLLLA